MFCVYCAFTMFLLAETMHVFKEPFSFITVISNFDAVPVKHCWKGQLQISKKVEFERLVFKIPG